MFSKSYKSQAAMFGAAALALTVSASSHAAFQLVTNGDLGTGDGTGFAFEGAGGSVFDATNGYIEMDNTTAAWGGVVVSDDSANGLALSTFGLTGGDTIDVQFDMRCVSGNCANGGVKIESWSSTAVIPPDTGDIFFASNATWQTFTASTVLQAGATNVKIVLLGIDNNSVYQFDNIGVANAIPVPAAAWLFGSALLGLGVARRRK